MSNVATSESMLPIVLDVTRALDREQALTRIAKGAQSLFGGRLVLAYCLNEDRLQCLGADSQNGSYDPDQIQLALGLLDPSDWMVEKPTQWDETQLAEKAEHLSGVSTARLIPLCNETRVVGLVLLLYKQEMHDTSEWTERANEFSNELVPAMENLETVARLHDLAIRDDTTECYNRRYFDQCIEDEVARCKRFGDHFALIFLDMDNLKQVNTKYGHTSGSKVLLQVSRRVNELIRTVDRLYRYGGDEFTIILPGTSSEGARAAAQRIRSGMAEEPFEMAGGETMELSASLGIAVWPFHGSTAQGLVSAADGAMRSVKSKNKGGLAIAESV